MVCRLHLVLEFRWKMMVVVVVVVVVHVGCFLERANLSLLETVDIIYSYNANTNLNISCIIVPFSTYIYYANHGLNQIYHATPTCMLDSLMGPLWECCSDHV